MDANDQKDIIDKVKESGRSEPSDNKSNNTPTNTTDTTSDIDVDFSETNDAEINEHNNLHNYEKNSTFTEKSNEYMFWQNLNTLFHATKELLSMDKEKINAILSNGNAWAIDHIATSADDIEEVYHFIESNKIESITNRLSEKLKQLHMAQPDVKPIEKPKIAPSETPKPNRRNKPFLPNPSVQPNPKANR